MASGKVEVEEILFSVRDNYVQVCLVVDNILNPPYIYTKYVNTDVSDTAPSSLERYPGQIWNPVRNVCDKMYIGGFSSNGDSQRTATSCKRLDEGLCRR